MTVEPHPIGRRATDRRADERRGDERRGEERRGEERRAGERRGDERRVEDRRIDERRGEDRRAERSAWGGEERRGGVAEDWRAAQPDAWRLEGFKMQIAEEARQRRGSVSMNLAVWGGVAIGVAGSVVALLT